MVANFSLKCAPLHTIASTVAKPFVYKQSISGNRKGISTAMAKYRTGVSLVCVQFDTLPCTPKDKDMNGQRHVGPVHVPV